MGSRAERSPREPFGINRVGWIFAKVLVLFLNGATFFTAGEGFTVTHNGNVISGKQ